MSMILDITVVIPTELEGNVTEEFIANLGEAIRTALNNSGDRWIDKSFTASEGPRIVIDLPY